MSVEQAILENAVRALPADKQREILSRDPSARGSLRQDAVQEYQGTWPTWEFHFPRERSKKISVKCGKIPQGGYLMAAVAVDTHVIGRERCKLCPSVNNRARRIRV